MICNRVDFCTTNKSLLRKVTLKGKLDIVGRGRSRRPAPFFVCKDSDLEEEGGLGLSALGWDIPGDFLGEDPKEHKA